MSPEAIQTVKTALATIAALMGCLFVYLGAWDKAATFYAMAAWAKP